MKFAPKRDGGWGRRDSNLVPWTSPLASGLTRRQGRGSANKVRKRGNKGGGRRRGESWERRGGQTREGKRGGVKRDWERGTGEEGNGGVGGGGAVVEKVELQWLESRSEMQKLGRSRKKLAKQAVSYSSTLTSPSLQRSLVTTM